MKRHFIIIFCVLFLSSIPHSFLFADNETDSLQVPLKTIIIKAPDQSRTKKTPVLFAHSTHLKFSCVACHHNWDRTGPVQGCSSAGCHEQLMPSPPSGKPSQAKNVMSITGAYHRACRQCHRDQQKELAEMGVSKADRESAVPVSCDGCHPKRFTGKESFEGSFSLPLGTLTLRAPEGADPKRASVEFPHGLHFDQDCQTCHHEWDGVEEIQNCTTSGCHDMVEADEDTRDINDPANIQYFLTAYHKACFHCHLDLNKQAKVSANDEATPPVRCNECHNSEE